MPPSKEQKKRILIVCEGTVTEPRYFEELRREVKNPLIDVRIAKDSGVPLTVVNIAVEEKAIADAAAKRASDEYESFDQVWAVFDVDEHPNIPEAKKLAADNGIELAISNPCFELWALLHFRDQTAHIDRDRLRPILQQYMPGYDKHLDFGRMYPTHAEAVRRATSMDVQADTHGESGRNPTTGVYNLTKVIISG